MFAALTDFVQIETAVTGDSAGLANDALNPENEAERLLTHIIFNPVLKAANRTLVVSYTLSVSIL